MEDVPNGHGSKADEATHAGSAGDGYGETPTAEAATTDGGNGTSALDTMYDHTGQQQQQQQRLTTTSSNTTSNYYYHADKEHGGDTDAMAGADAQRNDDNDNNNNDTYYYQDEDGNYYYYGDPQQQDGAPRYEDGTSALVMAGVDGGHGNNYYYYSNDDSARGGGGDTATRDMLRAYEYDNWQPYHYHWFVDLIVDVFLCLPYRVYLTILLYSAGALLVTVGLDYSFAMLYRVYVPPSSDRNNGLQVLCYLAMFFFFSFVQVGALCVLVDMLHGVWAQTRDAQALWGMSHIALAKRMPPFIVYLCLLLVTIALPVLWGVIDAGVNHQSFVFVAQRYANVAVLVAAFLVVTCYVWFYWRALVYKYTAWHTRRTRDDFVLRAKAYKHRGDKMHKQHWYHAVSVLEEFGLDGRTLRYNSVIFTIAAVPLFGLYAGQALSTYTEQPSVVWALIATIALMCVYVISWLTLFHRKGQWASYTAVALLLVLLVLGAVGGGVSGAAVSVAIVIVLFLASQGMLTRKRRHTLTSRERSAALRVPVPVLEQQRQLQHAHDANAHAPSWLLPRPHMRLDTYLCCCHDVLLDCLRCVDVRRYFGYVHPDVRAAERHYARVHVALRVDQAALLLWWLVLMFAVAFVIAMANGVSYRYNGPIAHASHSPIAGVYDVQSSNSSAAAVAAQSPLLPLLCTLSYNVAGRAVLRVYDLVLLSALGYTYGENGDADFGTWFAATPTLVRRYPLRLPRTLDDATNGIRVPFSDYVDLTSDYHVITLNANSRGMSIFRSLDDWGESMALQAASAVAPLLMVWPERYRAAFVQGAAFLKNWLPRSTALDAVRAYLDALLASDADNNNNNTTPTTTTSGGNSSRRSRVLLVGDQFNGGYVKLLASIYRVPFVVFNPPGVKYKVPHLLSNGGGLLNGTQISSVRSLWSYIDSLEDSTTTLYVPCNADYSANRCGRITSVAQFVLYLCGDAQGRTIVDARTT